MGIPAATIFIVDDDAAVRSALSRLIRSAGWNVETFAYPQEFLQRAPAVEIGCLVLDVHMPDMTGPELHDRMAEAGISLPVVYLTGKGDVITGVSAMKRGAVDYLLKPVDDDVLLQAIGRAIERHASEIIRDDEREGVLVRYGLLSPREREVLFQILKGRLNKQIAAELGIAEKTVKVHRGRLMEKMKVRSVAELVHICEVAGISKAAFPP
jgi:FixJ family two-component response regulator